MHFIGGFRELVHLTRPYFGISNLRKEMAKAL